MDFSKFFFIKALRSISKRWFFLFLLLFLFLVNFSMGVLILSHDCRCLKMTWWHILDVNVKKATDALWQLLKVLCQAKSNGTVDEYKMTPVMWKNSEILFRALQMYWYKTVFHYIAVHCSWFFNYLNMQSKTTQ